MRYLALLVLLVSLHQTLGSEGDRDRSYLRCLAECETGCPDNDNRGIFEYLLLWTCPENCRYKCMRENHELRQSHGSRYITKYYGKWPFVRILGCQEIASVLFSLANAVPHYQYISRYRAAVPASYHMRDLWSLYSVISINTWIWSAVFHARDCVLTERLDYFSASFTISTALGISLIRVLGIRRRLHHYLILAACWTAFFAHISYLQLVHFDYGWNMTVSLAVGLSYCTLWITWGLFHTVRSLLARRAAPSSPLSLSLEPSRSPGRVRPYAWKAAAAAASLMAAAALEIYDFPPFFDVFDAHAIWHGITPAISYLFYSFLMDDAKLETEAGATHKD